MTTVLTKAQRNVLQMLAAVKRGAKAGMLPRAPFWRANTLRALEAHGLIVSGVFLQRIEWRDGGNTYLTGDCEAFYCITPKGRGALSALDKE